MPVWDDGEMEAFLLKEAFWSDRAQPRWASDEPQPGWVPIPVLQARPSISPSYRICPIEGNSLLEGHSGFSCRSSFASSIWRWGKRLVSSASGLTCGPRHAGALKPSLSCFRLLQADSGLPQSQCCLHRKTTQLHVGKQAHLEMQTWGRCLNPFLPIAGLCP